MKEPQEIAEKAYKEAAVLRTEATPEERQQWLSSPLTKAVLLELQGKRLEYMSLWSDGIFTVESVEGTIQKNSEFIGRSSEVKETIDLIKETGGVSADDYSERA